MAKLSVTERKVVKAKVKAELNDIPVSKVALEVFPNQKPESARVSMHENLRKPTVQEALEAEFEKQGITMSAIVAPIKEGLEATNTVIIRDKGIRRQPGESDESFEERLSSGSFVDERPDHSTRLRAADMAAKFLGIGKTPKGDDAPPTGITFNIQNNYAQGE